MPQKNPTISARLRRTVGLQTADYCVRDIARTAVTGKVTVSPTADSGTSNPSAELPPRQDEH